MVFLKGKVMSNIYGSWLYYLLVVSLREGCWLLVAGCWLDFEPFAYWQNFFFKFCMFDTEQAWSFEKKREI